METPFNNGLDLSIFVQNSACSSDGLGLVDEAHSSSTDRSIADQPSISAMVNLLSRATRFQFSDRVAIVWKPGNLWSVVDAGQVLNVDGDWEYEPTGSGRSTEFKERTRFSLEDAFQRAKQDAAGERL